MKYKAIIFDFFGVICSEISMTWFKEHLSEKQIIEVKNSISKLVDVGAISENDFFERLSKISAMPAEEIKTEWYDLADINEELVKLIRDIKNDCNIYLCSNSPSPLINSILKENNLYNLFQDIIISSEVHMAKPNLGIFKYALEKVKCIPSEVLFIDDNENNIKTAESLGINGLLFIDVQKLEEDLKK